MSTQPEALRLADELAKCWGDSRIDQTIAELRRLHAECEKLRAFAQDIMDEWPDVGSLDGYDLQMLGVKHGLLAETTHHKPCCDEGCACAVMCYEDDWKEGVQCYRSTALLKPPQMV